MNIVGKRFWYFILAAVIAVVCLVSLFTLGIDFGVEFKSGSILNITFDSPVDQTALRQQLDTLSYKNSTLQSAGSTGVDYIIRTPTLDETTEKAFISSLEGVFGNLTVNEFDNVSAQIASETTRNASFAVIIAIAAMLLYIAYAFRKMPNPFKYGVCAVAGLAFDLLVALGIFSILGSIRGWQVDLMFVTGILAILGYSINNTVIIFDRMRENTARGVSPDIEIIANVSIVETLGRSFNSSLTTLFTLLVLALFVGSTIQNFVIVLIIGVVSGVFTSTFVSPELLVAWQKKKELPGKNGNLVAAKAKS